MLKVPSLLAALALLAPRAQAEGRAIEDGWLRGDIDYAHDARFVRVARGDLKRHRRTYLHREAYEAFRRMAAAARKDGIRLRILSAARNFEQQRWIWERKWQRYRSAGLSKRDTVHRILEYSAVPGTSRHHWGTDIDVNAVSPRYFKRGRGLDTYDWMIRNAGSFGFAQTYGPNSPYAEERWHWTYRPVADALEEAWLTRVSREWLRGFSGASLVRAEVPVECWVDLDFPPQGPATSARPFDPSAPRPTGWDDRPPELIGPVDLLEAPRVGLRDQTVELLDGLSYLGPLLGRPVRQTTLLARRVLARRSPAKLQLASYPTPPAPAAAPTAAPEDPARVLETSAPLRFDPKSAKLSAGASAAIDAVARDLGEQLVVVEAHARSESTAFGNVRLSLARAEAVRARLVRAGVPAEQVRILGHGAAGGLTFSHSREVTLRAVPAAEFPPRITAAREEGSDPDRLRIVADVQGVLHPEQVEIDAWYGGLAIRVDRAESERRVARAGRGPARWIQLRPDPKRAPAAEIKVRTNARALDLAEVRVERGRLVVLVPRTR